MDSADCHIVFNATSLRPGGGLTVLLGILKGLEVLPDRPCRATVICSADETCEAVLASGVDVKIEQPLPNASQIQRLLWNYIGMRKFVNGLSPDIFFSFNQYIGGLNCPQVVYHINLLRFLPVDPAFSWKRKIAERIRNYSARQALKRATANVFESSFIQKCAEEVYRSGNQLDRVIYIGIPDELIDASRNRLENDRAFLPQIVSITNHNPHKDNSTLVRSFAEVVRRDPEVNWRLEIAGGLFPELWEPYKELAIELKVIDRINWLGFIDVEQLTELLQQSVVLVSTSRVESFCMVALEAMARGCPAIVAESSSMPESVSDAGILVPAGDASAFAAAILQLYHRPECRCEYVRRGYEHIEKFRWKVCGDRFFELFTQILSQDRRSAF